MTKAALEFLLGLQKNLAFGPEEMYGKMMTTVFALEKEGVNSEAELRWITRDLHRSLKPFVINVWIVSFCM